MAKTKEKLSVVPVNKYLLVQRKNPEDVTIGGIIVPTVAKKKLNQGTILKLGNKCEMGFNVGDEIIFNELGSFEIHDTNDDEYILVPEDMVYVKYCK
jgi:chaperonin GroES